MIFSDTSDIDIINMNKIVRQKEYSSRDTMSFNT